MMFIIINSILDMMKCGFNISRKGFWLYSFIFYGSWNRFLVFYVGFFFIERV